MKDFFQNSKNVVSAVLGVSPKYVHINNAEHNAAPIELEKDDVIWVSSDGITVPVCGHEIPALIYSKCMGDLDSAREEFILLAESRRSASPNPTMCECKERPGKNDDKTITLRYAADAFEVLPDGGRGRGSSGPKGRFGWLCARIRENPTNAALSKSFRLVLRGCADAQLPAQELMQVFDAIISLLPKAAKFDGLPFDDLVEKILSDAGLSK